MNLYYFILLYYLKEGLHKNHVGYVNILYNNNNNSEDSTLLKTSIKYILTIRPLII